MYNVKDFGAAGEGTVLCTAQIQRAIDDCHAAGGGTVYFPAGTYLTGSLWIRSHCRLYLETGATLLGSLELADYAYSRRPHHYTMDWTHKGEAIDGDTYGGPDSRFSALLLSDDQHDIAIEGGGIIDGRGGRGVQFTSADGRHHNTPLGLLFYNTHGITVTGITIRNPGVSGFRSEECNDIRIDGVTIRSWNTLYGDSIDIDGGSNIVIANCNIESGDDAISFKSYTRTPCRNIAVSNCLIKARWAAIRWGVDALGDMSEITVDNCVMTDCNDGLKIQSGEGSVMQNIRVSNIVMRNVHRPVFMTLCRFRLTTQNASVRPPVGTIEGVTIAGLRVIMPADGVDMTQNCFLISGMPEKPVRDIRLRDISIEFEGGGTPDYARRVCVPEFLDFTHYYADIHQVRGELPAAGLYLRHAEQVDINGCRLAFRRMDARPALFACAVRGLAVKDTDVCGQTSGLLRAMRCEDVTLLGCRINGTAAECCEETDPEWLQELDACSVLGEHTDRMFEEQAAAIDQALEMKRLGIIRNGEWRKTGRTWEASIRIPTGTKWVYLPRLYGNVRMLLNGGLIGEYRVERPYRALTMLACPVGDAPAVSVLRLEWEDITDMGGFDCKMPFGDDFKPVAVGLHAPAELRGQAGECPAGLIIDSDGTPQIRLRAKMAISKAGLEKKRQRKEH